MDPRYKPTDRQISYMKRLTGISHPQHLERYVARKVGVATPEAGGRPLTRAHYSQAINHELKVKNSPNALHTKNDAPPPVSEKERLMSFKESQGLLMSLVNQARQLGISHPALKSADHLISTSKDWLPVPHDTIRTIRNLISEKQNKSS